MNYASLDLSLEFILTLSQLVSTHSALQMALDTRQTKMTDEK